MNHRLILIVAIITSTVIGGVLAYQLFVSPQPVRTIPFATIAYGGASGYSTPQRFVINNQSEWFTVWTTGVCSGGSCEGLPYCSPLCPQGPPDVNFADFTVIAVFFGFAPTHGYHTNVTDVKEVGSSLHVGIIDSQPGNCGTPQVPSQPFHVVSIPKNQLPVVFDEKVSLYDC